MKSPFTKPIRLDGEGLMRAIRREGDLDRVYFVDLYVDWEIQKAIGERYGIWEDIDPADPWARWKKEIAYQRFVGYDWVNGWIGGMDWPLPGHFVKDTSGLERDGGRRFIELHTGPIQNWEDFEKYPWPSLETADLSEMEWLNKNLPDDMVLFSPRGGHNFEFISMLMGYESLCYALVENRELVKAICDRLDDYFTGFAKIACQFDRVTAHWGTDDWGFRTGTLISPDDLREFIIPGHQHVAEMAHSCGKSYLLHCCGQIEDVMPDILNVVKADVRHSFEDTILPVTDAKKKWGDQIALFGGIDMDFICRATPEQIRKRVRETLDVCQPGGGYCLGTGNSVANYIPVENYLAMLDEGRLYGS